MKECCYDGIRFRVVAVTMHTIEGSNEEEIRQQLNRSLDAFFDFYPEI